MVSLIIQLDNYKNLSKFYSRIFFSRIFIIGLNFLTTAFLINNLGDTDYGIYITLFSVINWVFILDLGVGKGMRNLLTELIEKNNFTKAKKLISTTFFVTTLISIIFFISYFTINNFIDFAYFFNLKSNLNFDATLSVFICVIILKLIFGNLDQILYSFQLSYVTVYITFVTALLFYLSIFFVIFFDFNLNFFHVSIYYFCSVLISYLIFFFWFFLKNKNLTPSLNNIEFDLIKFLFDSGIKIFIIQILFFLMLSLDRFIILKFFDGDTVTNYDIVYRVMTLLLFPFSVIAQPLWSSYAAAKANNNYEWINKIINRLYLFSLFIIVGILLLSFTFNFITDIWLGKVYKIELSLKLLIGFLLFNVMWSTIHSDILYGISAYKFMFISILIGLVLKILVLIILVYTNNLSLNTIVISSIVGYFLFSSIAPFYIKEKIKFLYEKIHSN